MGTRADFYVRKQNSEMEWVGSIAWDGYQIDQVEKATDEASFRQLLKQFLDGRDDSTYPENGWPWPWNNSKLTDEIWLFNCEDNSIYRGYDHEGDYGDATTVQYFSKGIPQFNYDGKADHELDRSQLKGWLLPDMKDRKNVQLGVSKSGLIVVSA